MLLVPATTSESVCVHLEDAHNSDPSFVSGPGQVSDLDDGHVFVGSYSSSACVDVALCLQTPFGYRQLRLHPAPCDSRLSAHSRLASVLQLYIGAFSRALRHPQSHQRSAFAWCLSPSSTCLKVGKPRHISVIVILELVDLLTLCEKST